MTRIYLVRHGQTDWNVAGRWQGHADVPLNAVGLAQAETVAGQLAGVGLQALYSSDLQRARQTAGALSARTGLPICLDARLREIHQGEWQGLSVSEIEARYGEAFRRRKLDPYNVAPPGGETVEQVRLRVVQAFEEIIARHSGDRVAVVSHGFALAVAQVHYQNRPIQQAWELIPANDEWRILEV